MASTIYAHSGRKSATTLNASIDPRRQGLTYCGHWGTQRVLDRYIVNENLLDSAPCRATGTMSASAMDFRLRNAYAEKDKNVNRRGNIQNEKEEEEKEENK